MVKRRLPVLTFLLAVPWIVSAQHLGAVVVSHDYDSANNTVTLHLVNQSHKDITAYNIKIKETYAGGINEHEYLHDTLQLMLNIEEWTAAKDPSGEQLRQQFGNGTFAAGTNQDEVIHVQPGLLNFEAVIDTVTYADKTAETTNKDALNRVLGNWKAAAQTIETSNEIIKHALANSQDPTPNETAAKEIEQVRHNWETEHHRANLNPGALQSVITDLRNAPKNSAYLNDYVTRKTHRAAVLREHAAPTVVNTNAADAK